MTNQEAIEIIRDIDKAYRTFTKTEIQALEMAIKALEQDSRKITLEDVKGYCNSRCLTIITNELLYDLTHSKIKVIEQEPKYCDRNICILNEYNGIGCDECEVTKSQKPKTGHWILQPSNKEQGERDFIWWKCSECGQVIYSETEKDRREYHAFCGKCGARMVEPQERSE